MSGKNPKMWLQQRESANFEAISRRLSRIFDPSSFGRRHFLMLTTALAGTAMPNVDCQAAESAAAVLAAGSANELFRVRIEIESEGNVHLPNNSLISREKVAAIPLTHKALFDYEERYRRPDAAVVSSMVTAADRFYHQATSSADVNKSTVAHELRTEVREVVVRRELLPEVIYCREQYLNHEELDLLHKPVCSMALDELLPVAAVRLGDQFLIEAESMRSLLNLSAVNSSEVKGEVVSLDETEAKFQLRGDIDGSVEGVPTVIRLVGKMTFDRQAAAVTWLALATHETREISKAEPGFDIAATIKMVRKPLQKTISLPSTPKPLAVTEPIPEDRLMLEIGSKNLAFSALMNRQWTLIRDTPGSAMMRMTDHDRSVAQCDFRKLSKFTPGQQLTMEALQQDVRKRLGEQLIEFLQSEERVTESGLRLMSLVASGAVHEVPIQWIIQHYSDDTGRRLMATFTMEGDSVGAFAGSDVQLASTLWFTEQAVTELEADEAELPADADSPPGVAALEKPAKDRISDKSVSSASDLK